APVEAAARVLAHVREAWDASMPAPLAAQDVVLTVPASFDEVARALTLEAAHAAGFPEVVLLEEPQAAFYAWLAAHEDDWRARVAAHPLVLVVAVGGHLRLGGDNMDLALARAAEARLSPGGRLDTQRFHGLVSQCRAAKERLLAEPGRSAVMLGVPGRGGAVVGGALTTSVTRAEVEALVLDGFFPIVGPDARPRPATG